MVTSKGLLGLVASVAALAVIVAACGGGEPTARPTAAPTRPAATAVVPAPIQPTATPTPTVAPTPAAPEPKYGGILRARARFDSPSWDTYSQLGSSANPWMMQLLSNLTRYKKGSLSEIEGDTAERWELSQDGKTITFILRKDVLWSDGKPFTSADVLYNFQRASDPKVPFNKQRVAAIATMETPDSATFKVTLKNVSTSFLPNIATPFMLMYPGHVTDMAAWQKSPVGTGPFVFKEYNKDTSYVFRKNTGYYWKDNAGRRLPYVDGVDYFVIPDRALSVAAFKSGRIQCGCAHDADFLSDVQEELERDIPGVNLKRVFAGATYYLRFNLQRAPYNVLAFRQALAIGFDKDKVGSIDRQGKNYRPAPPLTPPEIGGSWGLPKAELIKIPGYNPDHSVDVRIAQQKFKESGVNLSGVNIQLMAGVGNGSLGELMATVLSELGVTVTPVVLAPADLDQRERDLNWDVMLRNIGYSIDDPADQFIDLMTTGGPRNITKYSNTRMDQLLQDQDLELDPAKRRAMLWEVQRIMLTEAPMVSFLWNGSTFGVRPEVRGWVHLPTNQHASMRLDQVWLEQ